LIDEESRYFGPRIGREPFMGEHLRFAAASCDEWLHRLLYPVL
jgi:hypothetical protein